MTAGRQADSLSLDSRGVREAKAGPIRDPCSPVTLRSIPEFCHATGRSKGSDVAVGRVVRDRVSERLLQRLALWWATCEQIARRALGFPGELPE